MKKQLTILLILVFILGSIPISFTENAVAQTKLESELQERASQILREKISTGQSEKEDASQYQETKTEQFVTNKDFENEFDSQKLERPDYVPGEVLVKFKSQRINLEQSAGRTKARQFATNKSLEKKEDIRKNNISVLKTRGEESVEDMVERLKDDPDVEYVEPNYTRQWASTFPNDTSFSNLWGLHNTTKNADIDAPEAWDIFSGYDSVVVAVLDSGIAYNHPDLDDNMWNGNTNHGWDFFNNDNDPIDDNGHGTHVAGTIGAEGNNNLGVAGVNWDVKLMALKVGSYAGNVGDIVEAIDFAISNNVKIINASFGSSVSSQAEFDAIDRFRQAGGLFIAAAMNGGEDGIGDNNDLESQYPADYALDNIISVAATDQNDDLANFSNYGATSVDVGAPGVSIYSTMPYNIFNEDFENVILPSIGNQFAQEFDNTWGTISIDSGVAVVTDYTNWGSYQNDIFSRLYSSAVDLNGETNNFLQFDLYCDTEPVYDYLNLWFYNGSNWDFIDTYTGSILEKKYYSLSNYVNSDFRFRFSWLTDESVSGVGCYVDNIKIVNADSTNGSYQYMDGTSMAAPHVAGLAALIWGYKPELSYSEVKDVILTTGDDIPDLHPITGTHPISTGKRINAYNALASLTDTTPPTLAEVTPVPALTNDNTPDYTFSSDEAGTISYEGSCLSQDTVAVVGNNTITFDELDDDPYDDCVITVTDAAENESELLNVSAFTIDATPPELELNGDETMNLTVGDDYDEPGATATDDMEGDLTDSIITGGDTVDTSIVGIYIVTYNVSDSAGNPAQEVIRTVIISVAPDETPPILTELTPVPTPTNNTTPDYTFNSDEVGTISYAGGCTSNTTDAVEGDNTITFDELADGTYNSCSITVTDEVDNESDPLSVSAFIIDSTAPEVTINDPTDLDSYVYESTDPSFTVAALITDNIGIAGIGSSITYEDGSEVGGGGDGVADPLPINIDYSHQFTLQEGENIITVSASDSAANSGSDSLTVTYIIPDIIPPVIILLGDNPFTVEVGDEYSEPGATAADDVDGDITEDIIINNSVDATTIGTYIVTYNVSDSAGNPAEEVIRTVNVVDDTRPSITLLGENPVIIEVGSEYTDAGATAADDVDGDITGDIVVVNNVDTSVPGSYFVTYNVIDSSGNPAPEVVRTVNVVDTTVPVITLLGDNPANMEVGYQYNDAGATAFDNYDGDITDSIVIVNNVDYNTVGTYTVTFNVTDSSGNPAEEVTRTVDVIPDVTSPVITLNGGDVTIYEGTTYEDAGATALDNIDGDITEDIVVTGIDSVDTSTPGVYYINYNVTDNAGNPATEVSRTVTVLALEEGQAALTSDMTINASSTEVMVGSNAPGSSTVSVPSTINNASLNVSTLMSGTDVTLPTTLTINSETSVGAVSVRILQSTLVFGGPSWDGVINLPQVQENSSVTVTPDSGYSASVSSVLEIGYGDVELTFDQAVRIKLTGQAGRYIGYSRNDTFTPITATCSADSQAVGNALAAGADCKIDVGSDLIIWTKHFTKFATYTQTKNEPPPSPPSGGGGGGGGGGGYVSRTPKSPSILINNGENTTYDSKVRLKLSATNMSANYSPQMVISNSANFTDAGWINYATSTDWTLIDGEGVRTVYVKFKNKYGTSAVTSGAIELKTTSTEEVETKELTESETQSTGRVLGTQIDLNLSNRLKGKLLLQVEDRGRIWYVSPDDASRYEVTFANALSLFEKLAVGISNADLNNIPLHSENWSSATGDRLKGKLLLQVEDKGRIWYVDFNGKKREITWNNLMSLFENLAVGITNNDLYKIAEGVLDASTDKVEDTTEDKTDDETEKVLGAQTDISLTERLRGKLLLQVEQNGRIWYVNPGDSERYEVTFANALPLFENFALGITNSDLNNIPLHNEYWASTTGERLKGKLLLQVEDRGRIWYVDFDGKRWEVTWANLMTLFESLALGITDADLYKIPAGSL